jgi:hypothetical protein
MQQRWPADTHCFAVAHPLSKIYVAKALGLVSFEEPDRTFADHDDRFSTSGRFGAIRVLGEAARRVQAEIINAALPARLR